MQKENNRNVRKRSGLVWTVLLGSLTLFITGLSLWLIFETKQILNNTQENIDLVAELSAESDASTQEKATALLREHDAVLDESIEFISKEEAILEFENELGDDLQDLGIENPLPDVLVFNIQAKKLSMDSLEYFKQDLENNPYIDQIVYQENFWVNLGKNFDKLNIATSLFCALFIIVAFVTIGGTIKLSMHNDRFLIRNMELVGATRSFIQKPYLIKGMLAGLGSSVIAIIGILLIQQLISKQMGDLQFGSNNILLLLIVFFVGPFISFVSSYVAIQKYLNAEVDELYIK